MKGRVGIYKFALTLLLGLPTSVLAERIYGSLMLGTSDQASESQAYGNNIAVDADFPREFDSGDGRVGSISVGYIFTDQIRAEGRIAIRRGNFNDTKIGTGERLGEEYILDGEIESTTVTIEGFYDLRVGSTFSPYLKGGLGISRNSYAARLGGAGVAEFDAFDGTEDGFYDNYADQTSTELAMNVGFGASISLSDRVTLLGEYQYITLGDAQTGQDDFTDGFEIDGAAAHEVFIGIRTSIR